MSRYQVFWPDDALNELAQIWLNHPQRDAVTVAASSADEMLADAPARVGEELREGLCLLRVEPLQILYAISQLDRRVEILAVKAIRSV